MSAPSDTPTYLHGCSATEQARLLKQARLLEATLFNQLEYSGARGLLEVGSGVGAQTEILLRRFPGLHVTGVDLSEAQLVAARAHLERLAWCRERYTCSRPMRATCRSQRVSSMRRFCAGCLNMCPRLRACSTKCGACCCPARRST